MLIPQLSQRGGRGSSISKSYSACTTGYSFGEEGGRRGGKGGERKGGEGKEGDRERDINFENSKRIFSKSTKCTVVSDFAVE